MLSRTRKRWRPQSKEKNLRANIKEDLPEDNDVNQRHSRSAVSRLTGTSQSEQFLLSVFKGNYFDRQLSLL